MQVKCRMPSCRDILEPHSPNRPGSRSKLQTSLGCICSGCPDPFLTLSSPLDPLFVEIGDVFLAEQKKEFGTNHIYSVDPFNELLPPNRSMKHSHIKVAKLIICKFKHVCFPSVFFHWLSICLSSVDYLSSVGRAVFQGLASDSEAVWLMQGWLFMFDQVSQLGSKLDQR